MKVYGVCEPMATENDKVDYFRDGFPVQRKSYCAFLDVLGFSERIRDSYNGGNPDNLLRKFHRILTKTIEEIRKDVDAELLYFKSFTDNIVLSYPQVTHDMENEFVSILWSMRSFQFQMMLSGFFVRGGLSLGPLFMDANTVYGQALLDAYDLESRVAVNPVIVLSDSVMQLVDRHLGYYGESEAPQLEDLVVGPDGRYFVSYLTECVDDTGDGEVLDARLLADHKWRVEQALGAYSGQPRVVEKFRWLADYHNYFCDTVAARFNNYSSDLTIGTDATKTGFRKLQRPVAK